MRYGILALAVAALLLITGCSQKDDKMNPHVILETTNGNIEIELYQSQAPATAENFLQYANEGFYDGTVFHRVIPGFMIQGGGFTTDGKQKPTKAPIRLETGKALKNDAGTIAMARTSDPNSATSQFFINVANNTFLNPSPGNDGYAVFGKVVKGMDVVNGIAKARTGNRDGNADWPTEDVVVKKAYAKK